MNSAVLSPGRRPAGRGLVLLVLAVLIGVLGMHGLGPGAVPMKASAGAGSHGAAMAAEAPGHEMAGDCSHAAGGAGHAPAAHHADATCAATGIGVAYAPPALTSALGLAPAVVVVALPSGAPGAPENGRAPPDLAELQLLRI